MESYSKLLDKRIIIIVALIIVITTLFYAIRIMNQNKTQILLEELRYESSLAKAYNSLVRQTLFKLVIEDEDYQYARALGRELSDSLSAISLRTMLRRDDMSSKWQGYFMNEVDNLGIMLRNRHYSTLNKEFLYSIAENQSPTSAEKEILEELYQIWLKADNFSKKSSLEDISYSSEISKDYTHFKSFEVYNQPSADLLAEHILILTRDMAKMPRTANHLIYNIPSFAEFLLFDYKNDRNFNVDSKEIAANLVNILREFKYQKATEVNSSNLDLLYEIRYTQLRRTRVLKVYEQYIKLEGTFGNYYIYPPIMWTNIGDKYGGVSPSKWDYKGEEFGDFPEIEGFYKIDSNLHEEIRQLIIKRILLSEEDY